MVKGRMTKAQEVKEKELLAMGQEEYLVKRRLDIKITEYFLNSRFTDEDREMVAIMRKYDYLQGFSSSEQLVRIK